jgi:hypothetical protein
VKRHINAKRFFVHDCSRLKSAVSMAS